MSYDLEIKEAELKDIDAVIEIAKRSFYKYDLKKYGMSFDLDSVEATYKGAVLHESQKLFITSENSMKKNNLKIGGWQMRWTYIIFLQMSREHHIVGVEDND